MSYNNHWGPAAHSPSGQSTGEGGGGGGRFSQPHAALEMEPMIATASGGSHGTHKGNDKLGSALGRLTGGSGGGAGGSAGGSSKYHGKRTSSGTAGRLLLVGLAGLAMLYLGFGVGRDDGVDASKSGAAGGIGAGGGPSPTPLVRKPPAAAVVIDQKKKKKEMPDDDDEPSDEDAEDDHMLDSAEDEYGGDNSSNNKNNHNHNHQGEEEEGRSKDEDDADTNAAAAAAADHDAQEHEAPSAGSKRSKPETQPADDREDPTNAVAEDEAALEDDEDEDDDATQDFDQDDGGNDDDDDDNNDNGGDNDDDDNDDDDDDDDSTQDFADEDKDGQPSPEEQLAQQNLEDDDNVVDDDTVSQDDGDDDGGDTEDTPGSTDDDDIDNVDEEDLAAEEEEDADDDADADTANAIAKKLIPGGVSKTPTMDYRIPDTVHKRFIKWSNELHQISEMEEYKGGEPKANWEWHPRRREDRFPGVEERIKYYMGKWYDSSIKMYGHSFRQASYAAARTTRTFGIMSSFGVNLYNLTQEGLFQCDQEENSVLHAYCRDYIDLAILHHGCTSNVIMHLGDSIPDNPHKDVTVHQYPVVNKVRHFCDPKYREQTGSDLNPTCGTDTKIDTIIWPMNRLRHLAPAAHIYKDDIPWSDKIGKAIWRGGYNDPFGMKTKFELVSKHVDSDLVDAKFAKRTNKRGRGKTKEVDESLMGPFISQEEQLKFKYLISIEGNDVSSGLKWMLMSNSVVLLPPTTYESWAMEGRLEPFVHYIPIKSDASDVEEKIQWAEDNPEDAQKIAERSTLFIYDMLFHPDALSDEQEILEGIAARYETNFGYAASKSVKGNHPLQHIHWDWHPSKRSERFPSIEDRVSAYLGKWDKQVMPMQRDDKRNPLSNTLKTNSKPKMDAEFIANGKELSGCAETNPDEGGYSAELKHYCEDAVPFFDERLMYDLKGDRHPSDENEFKLGDEIEELSGSQNRWFKRILIDDTIKVVRFGDVPSDITNFPVFTKARRARTETQDGSLLWPMGYSHEYELVESGLIEYLDISFEKKKPKAVWRGGFGVAHPIEGGSELKHRINLVERSQEESSEVLDALFVFSQKDRDLDHNRSEPLRPKQFMYEPKDDDGMEGLLHDVLSHRYLIASEDDFRIDSDLKWMLLSQSVVFMVSDRRYVTWFMEQELESYVHYVPIKPDYSDVEEQVAWCEKNLAKCEKIAERATLFVHDMLFHMTSEKETTEIQMRIMEKYTYAFNSTTPKEVKAAKEDDDDDGKKKKDKDGKRRH